MPIESILVASVAPMEMHRANSGQNELGNASAIKRRPDGRVYISGQMQRHALFEAISRLNESDPEAPDDTYVSNGDATTFMVEKDLRADLGGFMITDIEGEPGRRTAPISATPAVAKEESNTVRDLLLRLDQSGGSDPVPVTQELSQQDQMRSAFHLDCSSLSTSERYEYKPTEDGNRGLHVGTETVRHVPSEERERRARLFVEATRYLNAYASQARNATTGEPQKVFITLDTRLSRKGARYFAMDDTEQERLRSELDERGAVYFEGDDTDEEAPSVRSAYENALNTLSDEGIVDRAQQTMDYAETFEALEDLEDFAEAE
ncbi:DevR family CRISPR-associated autoregulator [Salinibacter ruber]|uniref:DevR family CRISPR-associated autoregulator n=1 Tax=Salinibacter ruber TaxID=146919 RepID=UPI0021689828|nr:DevR family CRISPR-associated autoregulator [Salinibacter ruber]MCS4172832.1 CRISPR-associated protein Cst2 [Salinibacter ruber]